MTQVLNFKDNSKKIAQHFLQSVVAVDDNIRFEPRPAVDKDELKVPNDTGLGELDVKNDDKAVKPLDHGLYYQDLSHEFARKGIICGGVSPKQGDLDSSIDAVVNTSKNSDITILDWQMEVAEADGKFATDVIKKISELDQSEGGRTRLICIYTAKDTKAVADTLNNSLKSLKPTLKDCTITFSTLNLTHWKIEVVDKGDIQEIALCNYLVNSFTNLTTGLLSNAALASIAAIRDNTHHLLHKFNSGLDTAYLSHVLGLISSPDMREQANEVAFDYAVDLISEELKSELQISQIVKDSLSKEVLETWPKHMSPKQKSLRFKIKMGQEKVEFNNETMKQLLSATKEEDLINVLENNLKLKGDGDKSTLDFFNKALIQLTFDNYDTVPLLDFCSLESTRRNLLTLNDHIPVLKQGTLIKEKTNDEYYLCIQPLCDTVRLKKGYQNFTFLKTSISNSDFTHVMRKLDGHLKLKIAPSAKNIKTIHFLVNDDKKAVLSAINETGTPEFFSGSNEKPVLFEWCGEFKFTISQAVVNGLAAQLARVGLDSFEWLRQKQK
ncbi:response regulator receiver domain [Pseudoalteromonas sp. D15MCD-2]|uniref:response regulator receiver domain n=1 Tax=Pseudoalteromonas sp. D15MCD-2 TaxID=3138933 RepID=UPI00315943E9